MNLQIPWTRRWVKEAPLEVEKHYSGLRRNDLWDEGRIIFKVGLEINDFETIPFALLFGPAGSGKSICLRGYYEEIERLRPDVTVLLRDLKEYSVQEIDHDVLEAVAELEQNDKSLVMVLVDSLDEVMLTEDGKACRELGRCISKYSKDRVRVRICSRPHPFNKELQERVTSVHGKDSFQFFGLLPLSETDVVLAANSFELNSDRFLETVHKKDVVDLAAEPMTLLALLQEFSDKNDLPNSKTELYNRMMDRLAGEVDPDRRYVKGVTPQLSVDQRRAVAENIAAALTFGGNPVLHTGDQPSCPKGRTAIDLVLGAPMGPAQADLTYHQIKEALTSGLFRASGVDGICFSHLSYQEYLAANWLVRQEFSWDQLGELLWSRDDGRLYPHLISVAGWLSSIRPEFTDSLISSDPLASLKVDPFHWTSNQKARALKLILLGINESSIPNDSLSLGNTSVLNCNQAQQILSDFIFSPRIQEHVRIGAIELATEFGLVEIIPRLLLLALDNSTPIRIREWSIRAVGEIGSEGDKKELKVLIHAGNDERLIRTTVRHIWPDVLSIPDVLAIASRYPKAEVLGYKFQIEAAASASDEDLSSLLMFALRNIPRDIAMPSIDNQFLDRIVAEGLKRKTSGLIWDLLARVFRRCGLRYHSFWHEGTKTRSELDNQEIRLNLLRRILSLEGRRNNPRGHLQEVFSIKHSEDAGLLVVEAGRQTDLPMFKIFAQAGFESQIWRDMELWTTILELSIDDIRWQGTFPWLFKEDLDSEAHRASRRRLELDVHDSSNDSGPVRVELQAFYDEVLADENISMDMVPNIIHNLQFDWEKSLPQSLVRQPWRERPGTKNLSTSQLSMIEKAIFRFLSEVLALRNEERGARLTAFLALEDLAIGNVDACKQLVSQYKDNASEIWIENLNYFGYRGDHIQYFRTLSGLMVKECELEAASFLKSWLVSNPADQCVSICHMLDEFWSRPLQAVFFNWAKSRQLDQNSIVVFGRLLTTGHIETQSWILDYLGSNIPDKGLRRKKWEQFCLLALEHISSVAWRIIWPKIRHRRLLCLSILRSVEYGPKRPLVKSLEERDLADLWKWLQCKYAEPAPDSRGRVELEPLSFLSNQIIGRLTDAGTRDAINALRLVASGYPKKHWIWSSVARADREFRSRQYRPWQTKHLWDFARKKRKQLVRDQAELMRDVLQELNNFSTWLHGQKRIHSIWNTNQNPSPKPEPVLSSVIREFLREQFHGFFTVVEPEVGVGDVDIQISATATGTSTGQAHVLVEVKWSHHRKARESMSPQLKHQYMRELRDVAGIYMVCWSKGDGITPEQQWVSIEKCREDLEAQAELLSTHDQPIRCIAVDASLQQKDIENYGSRAAKTKSDQKQKGH